MPEDPLETTELQEKLDEALERAEEAAEERASPAWTFHLSLSTAMIAVLAAIASLQAGSLINQALLEKNQAVLLQAKASDQWAYYQAKGIKGVVYQTQADSLAVSHAALARQFQDASARYKTEQAEIKTQAEELEKNVQEKNEAAEHFLHHHHQFALAVTLFQVAIALSAIAALTRRKPLWFVGLGIAVIGAVFFLRGFL